MELQDYRHIWLYAKGHYQRENVTEDLQNIIAERNMLEPSHVHEEYLYSILLDILIEHAQPHLLADYILEAFGVKTLFPNKPHTREDGLISLLGKICCLPVRDADKNICINLGVIDTNILPKRAWMDINL
jgi:hypothetical protein